MKFINKWGILCFVYLICIVGIYTYDANKLIENVSIEQLKHDKPIGEITKAVSITQSFVAKEDNISAMEFMVATYMRKNTGKLIVHVKRNDKTGKDIATKEVNIEDLKDNEMFKISFSDLKVRKGDNIYVVFEAPQGEGGNAVTLYFDSLSEYSDSELCINDMKTNGSLKYRIYYKHKKGLNL